MQLEKKLQEQVYVRCALETTLSCGASSHDITNETIIPKPAIELLKEIAVLELEVGRLEKYLLSLYRKAFDQRISSLSPSKKNEKFESPSATPSRWYLDFSRSDMTTVREKFAPEAVTRIMTGSSEEANSPSEEKLMDFVAQHSRSSLSRRSDLANRTSLLAHASVKAVLRACESQPSSMMEYAQHSSSHAISLAEHLSTSASDYIPETPTKLSQDMVKCISDIYCRLADSPSANHCLSSPTSSLSSSSAFSPKDQCDLWSPGFRNDSSSENRLDSPVRVEGLKDFNGVCSRTVEVLRIHKNGQKLSDTRFLLQDYRSLISQLKDIDPSKMTHEEKLAFWVNVHNALVMHAFLAYGIPRNNMKRMFLLLKAAYNVGGQVVSADDIQNSILGCRISRPPGQWLRLLLTSKTKFKANDERIAYATKRPEPLLHYALSCGSHSDPVVRIYTPNAVFQELEAAKGDYIRATHGVGKDQKVLLPKLVESYAKDSGLCPAGIMEMMQQILPGSSKSNNEHGQIEKSHKNIEWVSHNFNFRYLILKEIDGEVNNVKVAK
ncbi:UNVERIFIED_CONTAM: hypothetical protein Sangu_0156900 [Sesamum angustifolium]|uniref:DUF547 domain-containing protein n=1 Tax=Sesamum angustifolium TaxID=2727405 RepID=A0AAW2RN56_9LAMI